MAGKATSAAAAMVEDGSFSHPILERIRKLLTSTDPEKWQIGGADLDHALRFTRPRPTYEQVLIRDIPNGSLVLHYVQPVECRYGPGGYTPVPNGSAHYSVEVRDRIFDAEKLIDPKFSANFAGKRCDTLATGDIAKSLFLQVKNTIRAVCKEKKRAFDQAVEELGRDVPGLVKSIPFSAWEKAVETQEDCTTIAYSTATEQGMHLSVGKETRGFDEKFRVTFKRDGFSNPHLPSGVAREAFRLLTEIEQEAQLEKLDDVLRDLGFE